MCQAARKHLEHIIRRRYANDSLLRKMHLKIVSQLHNHNGN